MSQKKKMENGITLISLVVTVVVLIILSVSITTNLKNNLDVQKLVYLRGDIENLTQKVSDFYNEYGEIPANIEYTNVGRLKDILNTAEQASKFYVIDLQAMQGLSLHYGKDYEYIKDADPIRTTVDINKFEDVYIINEVTHNIFYVKGVSLKEGKEGKKTYYTNHDKAENIAGTNVANPPEMLEGMERIMLKTPTNTSKGQAISQKEEGYDDSKWYSYEDKKWANAQTQDGSMWVWIPRFAYKIEGQANYSEEGTANSSGRIKVKFLIGTTDNYYDEDGTLQTAKRQQTKDEVIDATKDYVVHPAFTNETSIGYANGGWDKELTGIWVSKFEAGYANKEELSKETAPIFKGLTYSMSNVSQKEATNIAKNVVSADNTYGLSEATTDSHLMKNSEWGAVVYLSQSQYGLNGKEISTNYVAQKGVKGDEEKYAITGVTSNSANEENVILTTLESVNNTQMNSPNSFGVYAWNQQNGQSASSTGTIHGIYDLSGGLGEIVSARVSDEESTKYVKSYKMEKLETEDEAQNQQANYSANVGIYGDSIFETSKNGTKRTSWFQDASEFFGKTTQYLLRGGSIAQKSTTNGMFAFNSSDGDAAPSAGFRVVLVAK